MFATFVIGLREGLEAALIVGIIATFLRSNGRRLAPMWIGVSLAILLSVTVGVVLRLVESALPQAAQEGMETVIGAVAIVFVTGMVLWMSTHARHLRRDIESAAQHALGDGTSRALAVMAFLAVLKEGFETAVFMLATFQAADDAAAAAGGAVLGVVVSVLIGVGIFRGGVRLNLGRFFTITSAFLVLVAAGLVLSALRTAHEAHWLNAGQQRTIDLHWLAPGGSIRGALFTGVLGIPPDPRVIEVLGWLCYLVPMALVLFWPRRHRPGAAASRLLKAGLAGTCVAGAAVLFFAIPGATLRAPSSAPLVGSDGVQVGRAVLTDDATPTLALTTGGRTVEVALSQPRRESRGGLPVTHYVGHPPVTGAAPPTISLDQLVSMAGNRLPVGLDPTRNPGPFSATWSRTATLDAWVYGGRLLDATGRSTQVVTLTGGGLATPRTMSVLAPGSGPAASGWSVRPSYLDRIGRAAAARASSAAERDFWGRTAPLGLLGAATALIAAAWWSRRAESSKAAIPAKVPAQSVA